MCKPEIIVLSITATAVIPKAKNCTAINEFGAMDTGTHRVSITPKHGWKSGNPATFPYIHEHLAKRGLHGPVNLGNLAWGVGQLSGTRQKWVLDRAEVHNLAKQDAGVHSCRAQPTLNPAILSAHARRRLVPLMQSWQHLAKCVGLRPICNNRNPISEARREYAPCAICVSPSFREAGGGLWPLKARTHT